MLCKILCVAIILTTFAICTAFLIYTGVRFLRLHRRISEMERLIKETRKIAETNKRNGQILHERISGFLVIERDRNSFVPSAPSASPPETSEQVA